MISVWSSSLILALVFLSKSSLNFLNHFFLICFFKFIPNYFGWLRILRCYFFFFSLHFMLWFGLMICVTSFECWTELASIIFKKIHSSSLNSLEIGILFYYNSFVNLIFLLNFALQFNIWWYLRFGPQCFDF
jgi:hypothetical protein